MKKLFLTLLIFVPLLTEAQVTLVPDSTFEQLLINLNIDSDGTLNGQILTSDVQNVTQLDLFQGGNGFRIQNMTGIEAFTNLESIEGAYHALNTINLTNLTKLRSVILPSNWINTIDLSTNTDLEYLSIGNAELEFMQYNGIGYLDLSNNIKLEYLDVYSLDSLFKINLKNHKANKLKILLGWGASPFVGPNYNTVCIEVDDPVAAMNKTYPYNNWEIINDNFVSYYFNDVCALSIEKFVNDNFKIYPNPTTEYVSVEQKTTHGVTLQSVQILDSSGKWIKSVKDHFNKIDVTNLSKGMYLFVIQTDKGNKTEKIIVK
ncbi:MAG: T9SS type A sorting domain-containing protein [Myroides sp.]